MLGVETRSARLGKEGAWSQPRFPASARRSPRLTPSGKSHASAGHPFRATLRLSRVGSAERSWNLRPALTLPCPVRSRALSGVENAGGPRARSPLGRGERAPPATFPPLSRWGLRSREARRTPPLSHFSVFFVIVV